MAAFRARWAIGLGLALLVVAIAALYWRHQAAPPAGTAPPAPINFTLTEKPFTAWTKFESHNERQEIVDSMYVDAMLGHQVFKTLPRGLPAQLGRQMLLDDDDLLLSSGRRLWSKESLTQPGFTGKFCYQHSDFCLKHLFDVYFVVDGEPAVIYDNQYTIERYPSRTLTRYQLGNVFVDEHKYITYDDRAVCSYYARTLDGQAHRLAVQVLAAEQTMPNAEPVTYPVIGKGRLRDRPLVIALDAPGFERVADTYPTQVRRIFDVPPDGSLQRFDVAASFQSDTVSRGIPSDQLERQITEYQRWFFDNVPYFDSPDPAFKKMWLYRWWIVRFNLAEPETPDLQGYSFYEGKLGFDNQISFAVPAQLKELTYLRNPRFGLDHARNAYRNLSAIGAVVDAPSSPYWGEMYSQWIGSALADFNRVHPIDPAALRELLPAMASDVRAWMHNFDPDGDFLPSRNIPRITGYDLDILSYWYFNGLKLDLFTKPPDLERPDFASFVYGNAAGIVELAKAAGDEKLADEFSGLAANIRTAVLQKLWDPETSFFYSQRAQDDERIPIREIHGFFPFTMRLVPDEPRYLQALKKFVDPAEFWSRYPPSITSTAHYRQWTWEMDGLTRNIAPHPISMGSLTMIRAMHDYHQDIITPEKFMDQLAHYTALMYPGVHPSDPGWRPNAHEYYSQWEPGARNPLPKPSDISHDFHSMYNALIVEGAVGLTPRTDDRIELRPAARGWDWFALDRLRYRNHDLTIIWDKPDGQVHYEGYPEGFSLYIDGQLAFTRPTLDPVIYDPAAHSANAIGG